MNLVIVCTLCAHHNKIEKSLIIYLIDHESKMIKISSPMSFHDWIVVTYILHFTFTCIFR